MMRAFLLVLVAAASLPAATCNLHGQTNLYVSGNPHLPTQATDEKATGGSQCFGEGRSTRLGPPSTLPPRAPDRGVRVSAESLCVCVAGSLVD